MHRQRGTLLCALLCELAALCGIAGLGDLRAHLVAFIALFAIAGTAFVASLISLKSLSPSFSHIVLVAIALRVPFFFTTPSLSDDVWRYFHDGRAQLAGVSPYSLAPDDPRTAAFAGPEHAAINHPDLVTVYPPAAQFTFALNALAGTKLGLWRLLLLASELLLLATLARLLRDRGYGLGNLAIYAWHPLAVVEAIGSAHLEPVGIALMAAGLYAASRNRSLRAGGLLGAAIAFKFVAAPVALVTDYVRRPRLVMAAGVAIVGLYALYWNNGRVFGSLGTFALGWEANAGVYALLAFTTDGYRARILAAALLLCALAVVRQMRGSNEERAAVAVLALLLLSPVVHPWYLLWLLCLVPMTGPGLEWLRHTALAWSLMVVGAYAGGALVWLEYGVVYGVLAVTLSAKALPRFPTRTSGPLRKRRRRIPI